MARVLLVDDDPDQLGIRRQLLERAGYEVRAVSSPAEALASLDPPPDVAVMDMCLPDARGGLTLIRDLSERSPETKIAVLTGVEDPLRGQAEQRHVSALLKKPCRTQKLIETIARLAVCLFILPVQ